VLGRFRLENIRPARRGEPQIEVTFDVDANGIVNVTAKDKATGAQQGITISESSNLDKSEVDRMIAEAERNRAEDQALRAAIDARNELDSAAYQVERRLSELGDAAAPHERARAEMLITDARQAVQDEAPLERSRELTGELQQIYQSLMAARPGGGPDGSGERGGAPGSDDDVIDAEFDRS
jgi:molecular chaperone DnaK